MNAVLNPSARLGRFELRHELGRGAQAVVWLAWDARLEREVAVKCLDQGSDSAAVREWLHEARAVSRLNHPNIVPVFEADEADGQPYLVFEYVAGPTLAAAQRARGTPAAREAREAVQLMLGVLDALGAAHAQGLVHRDLKPSNVLMGEDGRPRVMDFGIAARVAQGDGRIVGTPGYISPEAARGEAPTPAMDVFAAGVMLAELLTGAPLVRERDPWAALRRILQTDLRLPADAKIDPALTTIVNRAMAREAAQRFASAVELREALMHWLRPPAVTQAAAGDDKAQSNSTLEFLLRRMRVKSDFPGLGESVTRVQRLANSERESVNSLADEILHDVALTQKLLRMVNSAHFAQSSSGGVNTVSRAIALVGFGGIRNLAMSLLLLDHMQDKAQAQQLKREYVQALMAGQIADALSESVRDAEPVFIAAMFQNLGRLLASFYFPEEAEAVRRLCTPSAAAGTNLALPPDENTAARQVLGITYDELGQGVAKVWGLPEGLRNAMRQVSGEVPTRALPAGPDRQRWLAGMANAAAEAIGSGAPEQLPQRLALISDRYASALGLSAKTLKQAVSGSQDKLRPLAQAMGLPMAKVDPGAVVAPPAPAAGEPDTLADSQLLTSNQGPAASAPAPMAPRAAAASAPMAGAVAPAGSDAIANAAADADAPTLLLPARQAEPVADMLAAGIQDITNSLVDERFKLNEVLRMVMETMLRALAFRRVVFCLRDPKTGLITGRLGLGDDGMRVAKSFAVTLKPAPGAVPDVFTAVCLKSADTLIADARVPQIAKRLPPWFVREVNAPSFLLLPMRHRDAPLGLLYADKAEPGGIQLDDKELNLLRTLRNQAVMAFRQASG